MYAAIQIPHLPVIPAKAGIQTLLHVLKRTWIPAFAGMTTGERDKNYHKKYANALSINLMRADVCVHHHMIINKMEMNPVLSIYRVRPIVLQSAT